MTRTLTRATGTCNRCPARVLWAMSVNNERMPIDPIPHPDGNVELHQDQGGVLHATVVGRPRKPAQPSLFDLDPEPAPPRFKTHFATCPRARR